MKVAYSSMYSDEGPWFTFSPDEINKAILDLGGRLVAVDQGIAYIERNEEVMQDDLLVKRRD